MSRKTRKPKKNIDFMLDIAHAFYKTGYSLAIQIKKNEPQEGIQLLASGVVNFSLATELSLKAANLLTGKDIVGHKLWDLYKVLPLEIKKMISDKFELFSKNPDKKLSEFSFVVKKDDKYPPMKKKIYEDKIKQLLILHNDSFENWRYLYEIKNEEGFEYIFNFKKMNVFILAVADVIKQLKKGKPPSFGIKVAN